VTPAAAGRLGLGVRASHGGLAQGDVGASDESEARRTPSSGPSGHVGDGEGRRGAFAGAAAIAASSASTQTRSSSGVGVTRSHTENA
jgi:hypothetical protein